ncbi:MAG: phage holin family protein [Patescibacteria group bacterium]
MGFFGKLALHVVANAIGISVANYFILGFSFSGDFIALIIAAIILTAIQTFLKPVLKLFFGPLIVMSLGLFIIVINAIILIILDFFSNELTIQGYLPLLYATLIISAINIIIGLAGKETKK